jgi:TonB family protein
MKTTPRTLKQAFRLAAATALASATWASAADITLAAVSPSRGPADAASVQDLGRIDVAAGYDAQVRGELIRHARHPDKFQASPRKLNGRVDIDFEVNRDGSVKQAAITRSSDSNALDGASLRALERARFLPIPAEAQADGLPRRYMVTFDYRYDGAN